MIRMKVVCKDLGRREYVVELESTSTLNDVFTKLEEHYQIDKERVSLIFSGQVLQDLTKTLESLDFNENNWFVLYHKKIKAKEIGKTKDKDTGKEPCTPDTEYEASQPKEDKSALTAMPTATPTAMPTATPTAMPMPTPTPTVMPTGAPTTVQISEEAMQSLLEIVQKDPSCDMLLRQNPALLSRLRDPRVLVNLANMVGIDLKKFARKDGEDVESESRDLSGSIWSQSYNVPVFPVPPLVEEAPTLKSNGGNQDKQGKTVLRLSADEVQILNKLKVDLLDILVEIPSTISQYQINTIVYECYIAAKKNPDAALNLLIDYMLEHSISDN